MPPKRSKRIAEKSDQANQQSAAALTPEEISTALAQLLEGQRSTQQQIEALLDQQPGGEPEVSRLGRVRSDRGPPRSDRQTQASTSRARDAREDINNRRATREARHDQAIGGSAEGRSARSRDDLRYTINRRRSQTSHHGASRQKEEGSSTDPTYCLETYPEDVAARIEDLERRIGGMARNMGRGSTWDQDRKSVV